MVRLSICEQVDSRYRATTSPQHGLSFWTAAYRAFTLWLPSKKGTTMNANETEKTADLPQSAEVPGEVSNQILADAAINRALGSYSRNPSDPRFSTFALPRVLSQSSTLAPSQSNETNQNKKSSPSELPLTPICGRQSSIINRQLIRQSATCHRSRPRQKKSSTRKKQPDAGPTLPPTHLHQITMRVHAGPKRVQAVFIRSQAGSMRSQASPMRVNPSSSESTPAPSDLNLILHHLVQNPSKLLNRIRLLHNAREPMLAMLRHHRIVAISTRNDRPNIRISLPKLLQRFPPPQTPRKSEVHD
jgi:hypothetical protein